MSADFDGGKDERLAELLDRQSRFADADAAIADIQRRFPESPILDLYLRRRPMVQKRQE